ncbi:MAG: hypothetical protein MRJ68_12555 [Nitrospira sp.]|nr:hypothetical protein [Nitrospira sp.]
MKVGDEEKSSHNNHVVEPGTADIFISPLGFHFYAAEFFDAARIVKRPDHLSPVPYYLYCRSIELSLKSFLLCKGVSKEALPKRELSHDLEKIWKLACKLGIRGIIDVTQEHQACLRQANGYYQKKGFEYFILTNAIRGYKDRPVLDVLHSLAELLLTQLKQCCVKATDNPPARQIRM